MQNYCPFKNSWERKFSQGSSWRSLKFRWWSLTWGGGCRAQCSSRPRWRPPSWSTAQTPDSSWCPFFWNKDCLKNLFPKKGNFISISWVGEKLLGRALPSPYSTSELTFPRFSSPHALKSYSSPTLVASVLLQAGQATAFTSRCLFYLRSDCLSFFQLQLDANAIQSNSNTWFKLHFASMLTHTCHFFCFLYDF